MGKFYRANEELANYLTTELKMNFHDRENEDLKYFTKESNGKQVKIDLKNNLVTLLDNKGLSVDSSSSFTDNQLIKFLEE